MKSLHCEVLSPAESEKPISLEVRYLNIIILKVLLILVYLLEQYLTWNLFAANTMAMPHCQPTTTKFGITLVMYFSAQRIRVSEVVVVIFRFIIVC